MLKRNIHICSKLLCELSGSAFHSIFFIKLNLYFMMLPGSMLCVGSEWHRYPSSFFVPAYIEQVKWIDDGFNGLLPFPFNETLGGTKAAPHYFNNKNKAFMEQFVNLSYSLLINILLLNIRKCDCEYWS
jgi:hypothetical protein